MIRFYPLRARLRRAKADVGPAECHGSLVGALCAANSATANAGTWQGDWLSHILGAEIASNDVRVKECATTLMELFRDSQASLEDEDMAFAPLLPEEDVTLSERAMALSEWCDGFVFGYGLAIGQAASSAKDLDGENEPAAAKHANAAMSSEAVEVLTDFSQIAQAAVTDVEEGEEDESAYQELAEYVRVGAMLLFTSGKKNDTAAQSAPPNTQLH